MLIANIYALILKKHSHYYSPNILMFRLNKIYYLLYFIMFRYGFIVEN